MTPFFFLIKFWDERQKVASYDSENKSEALLAIHRQFQDQKLFKSVEFIDENKYIYILGTEEFIPFGNFFYRFFYMDGHVFFELSTHNINEPGFYYTDIDLDKVYENLYAINDVGYLHLAEKQFKKFVKAKKLNDRSAFKPGR